MPLRVAPIQNDPSALVKIYVELLVLRVIVFLAKEISKAVIIQSIDDMSIYDIDIDLAMAA